MMQVATEFDGTMYSHDGVTLREDNVPIASLEGRTRPFRDARIFAQNIVDKRFLDTLYPHLNEEQRRLVTPDRLEWKSYP